MGLSLQTVQVCPAAYTLVSRSGDAAERFHPTKQCVAGTHRIQVIEKSKSAIGRVRALGEPESSSQSLTTTRRSRRDMGKIVAGMATVHAPQLFTRPPEEDPRQLDM